MAASGFEPSPAIPAHERLAAALTSLLGASPGMPPDLLGEHARRAVELMGGRDGDVLLVDLAQRHLVPLDRDGSDVDATHRPVDGPGPGEAYRTERLVREPAEDGTRLWIPILDSADRLGVLGATVGEAGPDEEARWALLAGLLGELVVTKSRYGDRLVNARRTQPLPVAAELRWALLPPLTFSSPEIVVSGILEPAHQIAGDTFDYSVASGAVSLALFDAMGHGIEAGRMADLAIGVHRHLRRAGTPLLEAVDELDRAVREEFGRSRFVTGQLAELDLASGRMSLVNAGHPDGVVFHADGTFELCPVERRRPLGLGIAASRAVEVQLREGDVVLLHTDGIEDARSPSGSFYGADRLYELVARLLAQQVRLPEVLRLVVREVLEHSTELKDDATAMLVGWRTGRHAVPPSLRAVEEVAASPSQTLRR